MQVKKIKKIKTTLKSKDYKECFHFRRISIFSHLKKTEKSENAGAHDILLNISAAFSFYVK